MFIVVRFIFVILKPIFLRDIYWTSPLYQILFKIQSELFFCKVRKEHTHPKFDFVVFYMETVLLAQEKMSCLTIVKKIDIWNTEGSALKISVLGLKRRKEMFLMHILSSKIVLIKHLTWISVWILHRKYW